MWLKRIDGLTPNIKQVLANPRVRRFGVLGLAIGLLLSGAILFYTERHVQATIEISTGDEAQVGTKSGDFAIGETPIFVVKTDGLVESRQNEITTPAFKGDQGEWNLTVLDTNNAPVDVPVKITPSTKNSDRFTVALLPSASLKPGKFKVAIELKNGSRSQVIAQDFTWGVLAYATDKSSYKTGEPATLMLAVLDDGGHTVCNARITLKIVDPNRHETILTTDKGDVAVSAECADKNVTNLPDYAARFTPQIEGEHQVFIEAKTDNGVRARQANLIVNNSPAFVVARPNTATRIYPVAEYQVLLDITPTNNFRGGMSEYVPKEFAVSNVSNNGVIVDQGDQKRIDWSVNLVGGTTYRFAYTYKAPPISPAFYELGPLALWVESLDADSLENGVVKPIVVFAEPRGWEIAADAVAPDGRLYYGDQTNTALRFQTVSYDFTFNGEQSYTHSASSSVIAFTQAVAAPTRDEIMVGILKADGELTVIKGINGYDVNTDYATAWSNAGTTPAMTCAGTTEADCTRAFDIAYESLSGRAMVVYADNTNQKLYYCLWNGTSWSPVSNCAPTNGTNDISLSSNGRPTFVEVKAEEGSDRILMGVSIDVSGTHEVESYIWSGSSWGNSVVATDTTNATANGLESGQIFSVAWESISKNALVVWATATTGVTKYKYFDGSSWGSEQTGPAVVGGNATIYTMTLCRDPSSNRVGFASSDGGNDGNFGVWKANGVDDGWTMGNEDAALETTEPGVFLVDCVWENSGGQGMWVAQSGGNSTVTEFQTVSCTSSGCTFSSIDDTIATAGADDGSFVRLKASRNSDDIMFLWSHHDRDLYAQHWNGSVWESAASASLEADISPGTGDNTNFHGQPSDYEYVPYSPWSRNWRFYDDETVNDPSTGLNGAGENATPTGVDPGEFIRLRINVAELSGFSQTDARKKLQYTSGCTPNSSETGCIWYDVGDTTDTKASWRYATTSETCSACSDGNTSTTSRLTGTNHGSPSVFYVADKDATADTDFDHTALLIREIDFPLHAQDVVENTTYYFRLYDLDQSTPVYREQDNDGNNDCATAACTYPNLTTKTSFSATYNQTNAKIESDDAGRGSGGTNITTPYTIKKGERVLVRLQVENTGDGRRSAFKLQYDKDAAASWADVRVGNELRPARSVSGATVEPAPIRRAGSCGGSVTFVAGEFYETRSVTNARLLKNNQCTEYVFAVETSNAVLNVAYRLRLYDATVGAALTTYTNYAAFTVQSAQTIVQSKTRNNLVPSNRDNLSYLLDSAGYSATLTDDTTYDRVNGVIGDATNDLAIHNVEATGGDDFGFSTSTSGDVNGDGYNDIIVGCSQCDGSGTANSGSVYIFHGGPSPDSTADVSIHNPEPTAFDNFGETVVTDDLNGDGYDDIAVGCDACDGSGTNDAGSVYVYYGAATMDTTADVSIHNPNPDGAESFGLFLSSFGDNNGDGYLDLAVGCSDCIVSSVGVGVAYLYFGGSSMNAAVDVTIENPEPTTGDSFSQYINNGGDVNSDGYDDIVIACRNCDGSGTSDSGSVFVYYGGSSIDTTADKSIHNPEATLSDAFGSGVGAGDINGDGFDDIAIGCFGCDPATTDAGRVYVYYGGTNMDTTSDITIDSPEQTANDEFGRGVGIIADANVDGFADIVVNCRLCDGSGTTDSGSIYVYYGATSMDTTADFSIHNPEATGSDRFGNYSPNLAPSDVTGDSFPDIAVTCPSCDGGGTTDSGSVYLYSLGVNMSGSYTKGFNNPEGTDSDQYGSGVSSAGDVNGDGYEDIIVGCYSCDTNVNGSGMAFIYYGGVNMHNTHDVAIANPEPSINDYFGSNVAGGGDLNGDGYDDVIVGCEQCDGSGTTDSGSAYIYFGSPAMSGSPGLSIHNPEATGDDRFGKDVTYAGDTNGDSFGDVVVGCNNCDGSGTGDSGSAFVYNGGKTMNATADVSIHNPEPTFSDQFGMNIAGSGDVNSDGYDDVIIGCRACDGSGTLDAGSAFIYYGGSTMNSTVDVSIHNPEPTTGDSFGDSVSGMGDLNGDKYSDIVIGCENCDGAGATNSGSAFAYYGGSSMDTTADVTMNNPDNTTDDNFGNAVAKIADVNGDGYGDVVVGCELCTGGGSNGGEAFVYFGAISMDSTADVTITNPEVTSGDNFGYSVATADVNRDGYFGAIIGCPLCDTGTAGAGNVYLYGGAKYSGITMYNFSSKHTDNTTDITTTWKGKTSVAASSANIKLQVYRFGATNAWVDVTTESSLAADTDGTISGQITTNKTEYYDGSNVSYWRIWQAATNQLFHTQYLNINFAAANPTYTQADYRFGSGTSNNIDYTGAPSENSPLTITSNGQDFRLRMLIHVGNATLSQSGQNFKLRFGEKPGGGCSAASYADVSDASGTIRYLNIGGLADGDDISSVAGDPDDAGHTKRYQDYEEVNNFTNSVASIAAGEDGVWDFSLENFSSVGGKTYCFKITKSDGTDLDTYSQYPEITVDEILTFTLDATSKDFGTITPGGSPTDRTSTLTTTTNAASGYQITLWQTQLLTKGSDTIANWTGTNASPTTFTGAGASAFGYNTNDSNLGGGTANRFTSASDLYAGFVTSGPGDIVADATAGPVTSEQFTVTYRLRAGSAQTAGTYATTMIFVNTATY